MKQVDFWTLPTEAEWILPTLEAGKNSIEWLPIAGDIVVPLFSTALGAVIAVLVARMAARDAAKLAAQADETREQAQWYTLMHKAATIASDLDAMNRWITDSLTRSNAAGLTGERLWQRLGGIAGGSASVSIDPAEFVPMISAQEYELIAEINYVAGQHQVIASSAAMYTQRRSELGERIRNSQSTGSTILISELSAADVRSLEPHMAELDSLAVHLRDQTPRVLERANRLVEDLGPAGQRYFRNTNFRRMKIVPLDN